MCVRVYEFRIESKFYPFSFPQAPLSRRGPIIGRPHCKNYLQDEKSHPVTHKQPCKKHMYRTIKKVDSICFELVIDSWGGSLFFVVYTGSVWLN